MKPADERKPWQLGKSAQEACREIPEMIFDRNMNPASPAKNQAKTTQVDVEVSAVPEKEVPLCGYQMTTAWKQYGFLKLSAFIARTVTNPEK